MRCTMRIDFTKMHGLGNDFVILDARDTGLPHYLEDPAAWSEFLSGYSVFHESSGIVVYQRLESEKATLGGS